MVASDWKNEHVRSLPFADVNELLEAHIRILYACLNVQDLLIIHVYPLAFNVSSRLALGCGHS